MNMYKSLLGSGLRVMVWFAGAGSWFLVMGHCPCCGKKSCPATAALFGLVVACGSVVVMVIRRFKPSSNAKNLT